MFTFLCIALVSSYCLLISTLNKYFSADKLKSEKKTIKVIFIAFILPFVASDAMAIALAVNPYIVCNSSIRFALMYGLPLVWDIPPICSILFFHYRNFGEHG